MAPQYNYFSLRDSPRLEKATTNLKFIYTSQMDELQNEYRQNGSYTT